MGCRLKEELGFDQFHIVDRQAGRRVREKERAKIEK